MPYPKSSFIDTVYFSNRSSSQAPGSDNWPITWAWNGHQYTSWGDGGGFGGTNSNGRVSLGFARLEGSYNNYIGYNVWGGKNPENPAQFAGKCYGIISIDGVLWMWRTGDASEKTAYKFQQLFKSTDGGATWISAGPYFDTQGSGMDMNIGFFAPTFCQFGKDYARARDDSVYMYAADITDENSWDIQIPGKVSMWRAHKNDLADTSKYEWFAGLNGNTPRWTHNINAREPVFQDLDDGVRFPSIQYSTKLHRYIMFVSHVSNNKAGGAILGIYEAPEPWGPWRTIFWESPYTSDLGVTFMSDNAWMLWWNLSNKWSEELGSPTDAVLVYSDDDEWRTIEVKFVISDTIAPTTPSGLNAIPISENQIELSWNVSNDPESGVAYYKIYRNGNFIDKSDVTSYSDVGLDENTIYTYEVSAVNRVGLESEKSMPATTTTLFDTTSPTIVLVNARDSTHVMVVYSEPVEENSATNTANYNINKGISIFSASLDTDLVTLILTTSPHTEGIKYTLTVNSVLDAAINPNTIEPNTQVTYKFVSALIISNLVVVSGKNYQVVEGLDNESLAYIDRTYTYNNLPAFLNNQIFIMTANEDKHSQGDRFLSFEVNQEVKIYIIHDDRYQLKPEWLNSFINTSQKLRIGDIQSTVFEKTFPAGKVVLGGNVHPLEDKNFNMYTVVVSSKMKRNNSIPSVPTNLIIRK